jgi:hypothetical protein
MASIFVRSRPTTNWAAATAYSLGDRRKATAAALGIHFEVTTAGTSHATTEPTWNTTVGGTTTDNTVTWTTRGSANTWVTLTAYVLGDRVIATTAATAARQNYVWECTTAGTSGVSEPTWTTTTPDTSTNTDGTVTWTLRKCSTWNNAHPFLGRIFGDTSGTGKTAAGDTVYVGHTHSETSAAATHVTIASPGTVTSPVNILCVSDIGDPASPGTAATTAVVASATTGNIICTGCAYTYGITYSAGSGSSNTKILVAGATGGTVGWRFEACKLKLATTSTSAATHVGTITANATCRVELENTVLEFGATGQTLQFAGGGEFSWHNTASAIAGTAPTTLITGVSTETHHNASFIGVDLSAVTGSLVSVAAASQGSVYTFANCKLGSGFAFTTGTHSGIGGPEVNFINCDSGSTNYNYYRETAQGTIVDETTLVKSGGASDGTTPLAWKMVSNANPTLGWPLTSAPIVTWNDNSGSSKTATVEILRDSATNLKDDEIWVDLDYLANSADPGGLAVSDRKASPVATAADQAASSVTWTTTGMSNPNKQALSVSFTPNKRGAVRARIMLAKASTTVYVNPQVTIT